MKKIFWWLLLVVGGVASAQTNAPATNAPAAPVVMDITSESWDFDQNLRQVIYHGHVLATDPQLQLTCGQLTVIFPAKGGHPDCLLAETNVVIDYVDQGEKYHVTAAKAVYVYSVIHSVTNETVTLTGSPKVERADGWLTGEPIYYVRVRGQKGKIHADNPVMHYRQAPGSANTNALPGHLF